MEHLFDPQHSTDRGDSGFGLSVSQNIMERIGGKIFVRNKEEKGMIFEIQVPGGFITKFSDSNLVMPD
jgi:signal transduction histidine kinase